MFDIVIGEIFYVHLHQESLTEAFSWLPTILAAEARLPSVLF